MMTSAEQNFKDFFITALDVTLRAQYSWNPDNEAHPSHEQEERDCERAIDSALEIAERAFIEYNAAVKALDIDVYDETHVLMAPKK